MNPYETLAKALAAIRAANGGSEAEKVATAALLFGLIHFHLLEAVKALKREDFDARLREDTSLLTFQLGGRHINVRRFSNQAQISIEFVGFDSKVIPFDERSRAHDVGAMP